MERSSINICTVLWLLLLYFLARFSVGKMAAVILIAVCAIVIIRILFRNLSTKLLAHWMPVLLMATCSLSGLLASGSSVVTYSAFTFVCLFFHACGFTIFRPVAPGPVIVLSIFFTLCVMPFVFYPGLTSIGTQPVDAAAEVGAQLRKLTGAIDERQSLRAFFYHGAELGQFAASILIVLSASVKIQIRNLEQKLGYFYLTGEVFIYVVLVFAVYVSDSLTSRIMVGYALTARYTNFRFLAIVPASILLFQFVTQLFFAESVANILQSGSFWWRYKMAEIIISSAPALAFTPDNIGYQANWAHSIFLDFAATFGVAGPLVLFGNQILMAFLPQYRSMAFGWSCLFLVIVAIQPVGASAVYIALALSLAYAESASLWSSDRKPATRGLADIQTPRRRGQI